MEQEKEWNTRQDKQTPMTDEERGQYIASLKRVIEKLEAGKESELTLALAVHTADDPDRLLTAMWGAEDKLFHMVAQLGQPIIEPIMGELRKEAALRGLPVPSRKPSPSELN